MASGTIGVLIADDHGIVAEGLRYLIEAQPDMAVVACVADGREAVRRVMDTSPDIVLMDNAMPELTGVEATRLICSRRLRTRVIMLSMYSDSVHVLRALQAGASGYVVKKSAANDLVEAIRRVHAGKRYLGGILPDSVIDQFLSNAGSPDPLDLLSSRERQVLQLLAEGHPVTVIGTRLSLSPKTVETYRSRMMQKLGIRGIADLVRFAIQRGVIWID